MSGDSVTLTAPADSVTDRLVRSLARLPSEGFDQFCVIGGLAVLCRVGALYRATSDVDTIVDDDAPAIAALRSRPTATPTPNGVSIDGTTIDIIEIGAIDVDSLPDDPDDRLFILSHRYAYDHAAHIEVEVVDPGRNGPVRTSANVAMATRSALIAMKLQSYAHRRGRSAPKQGSDMQDLLALLADPNDDLPIAEALTAAPYGMGALCTEAIERHLVDDADVAAGRLRRYTSSQFEADEVRTVGRRIIGAIAGSC